MADDVELDRTTARAGGIQVISRAAAVLRALKETPNGQSLGQIADRVDLPRSTVQRIVQALEEERLVISSSQFGSVRLGPELHSLAEAAQFNVVDLCRPVLQRLAEATGETCDLSVFRNGRMIFLDQVQGTHRLRAVSSVGESFPLTTTANGRAVLAALGDDDARKRAEAEWASGDGKGNWPALAAALSVVRESGIAEDIDDHTDGISALGIAFRDFSGDINAISVPVPSTRFAEQKELVARQLSAARRELARIFGC